MPRPAGAASSTHTDRTNSMCVLYEQCTERRPLCHGKLDSPRRPSARSAQIERAGKFPPPCPISFCGLCNAPGALPGQSGAKGRLSGCQNQGKNDQKGEGADDSDHQRQKENWAIIAIMPGLPLGPEVVRLFCAEAQGKILLWCGHSHYTYLSKPEIDRVYRREKAVKVDDAWNSFFFALGHPLSHFTNPNGNSW